MKILVASDTHGNFQNLKLAIEKQSPIDMLIHLGDGEKDVNKIREFYPDLKILQVKGNCDINSQLSSYLEPNIMGKRLFIAHGDKYNVKIGLYSIFSRAKEQNSDILLFGHTHQPFAIVEDGMHIMNPGSLNSSYATYGLMYLENDHISMNIIDLSL